MVSMPRLFQICSLDFEILGNQCSLTIPPKIFSAYADFNPIHLYFRHKPIENKNTQKNKKNVKKIKSNSNTCNSTVTQPYNMESITSNLNIQNVVQCHCHMHGYDVKNQFYIYQ